LSGIFASLKEQEDCHAATVACSRHPELPVAAIASPCDIVPRQFIVDKSIVGKSWARIAVASRSADSSEMADS
jgi:hypothetical protein